MEILTFVLKDFQLLVLMTNDPVTSHSKPLLFILLSTKDEEIYRLALRGFREFITNHGNRKIALESITIDFEITLMNGVESIFPNVKKIGFLFHFKNALWRRARRNKSADKNVIDKTSIARCGD